MNRNPKDCKHSQKKKLRGNVYHSEDFYWCKTCGALQIIDSSKWRSPDPKERRTIYGEWELPRNISKLLESSK